MTREEVKRINKAVSIFNILLKGQRTYVSPKDAQYAYRTAIEYLNKYKPPVEPQIPKAELKDKMLKYGFHAPDMTVTEFVEDFESL